MGAAAAAVAMAERRMVEAFEIARATSPDTARTPDELAVDTGSIGWRRLHSRAVVRESAPGSGRYYLDREVWQAVRRTRMRMLVVLIVIILGILLYVTTVASRNTKRNTPPSIDSTARIASPPPPTPPR
jgi:hypothetical protein